MRRTLTGRSSVAIAAKSSGKLPPKPREIRAGNAAPVAALSEWRPTSVRTADIGSNGPCLDNDLKTECSTGSQSDRLFRMPSRGAPLEKSKGYAGRKAVADVACYRRDDGRTAHPLPVCQKKLLTVRGLIGQEPHHLTASGWYWPCSRHSRPTPHEHASNPCPACTLRRC